jgi:glycosyltransferase involved in cell wall biosynthesis
LPETNHEFVASYKFQTNRSKVAVVKILFLISGDRVPSSRFRVLPYVPYLRSLGHKCTVASSFPQKYDYFPWIGFRPSQLLKRLVRMWHLLKARLGRYDVIFIDREIFDDDTISMEARFRKVTSTLILDVDDAVFLRHPQKFERLARMSDLVIAGNRFLKERIEPINPNIVVVPTCIDMLNYPQKEEDATADSRTVIGWIGTTGNLQYLQVVAPALRKLATCCEFELRLIAPENTPLKSIDLTGVDVHFVRWQGATEVDELLKIDVGLMPLFPDDEWNVYKCGLKLLQYMAIGIPGVASPIGVNTEIVQHGENGFLASEPDEWAEVLLQLVRNPGLRQSIGKQARRTVEQRYSIQTHLPRLINSLQAAIRRDPTDDI